MDAISFENLRKAILSGAQQSQPLHCTENQPLAVPVHTGQRTNVKSFLNLLCTQYRGKAFFVFCECIQMITLCCTYPNLNTYRKKKVGNHKNLGNMTSAA